MLKIYRKALKERGCGDLGAFLRGIESLCPATAAQIRLLVEKRDNAELRKWENEDMKTQLKKLEKARGEKMNPILI